MKDGSTDSQCISRRLVLTSSVLAFGAAATTAPISQAQTQQRLHQLPTAECVQIRRRRDQAGWLVPALLPEDLVVGLKMQLKLHPKWAFSIIRTDGSGY
jgi:hypothetical protein